MSRRLEPTVFLAMISPITVGLVAGTAALTLLAGGPIWLAVVLGTAVYAGRVAVARGVARRVAALPRRIDPFALREPWRFFVRDALQAQKQFADSFASTPDGPLRDRLAEISGELDRGVTDCWEAAQRGQQLTDARRAIPADMPGHDRVREREDSTRESLQSLDERFEEAVARAIELGTRQGDPETAGAAVAAVVADLEALRLGLGDVGVN